MAADITGSVAIITGAGSGIGAAIASRLAEAGCPLYLIGRTLDKLESTKKDVLAQTPNAQIIVDAFDVTSKDALAHAVQECVAKFGSLSIVINNAGKGCLTSSSLEQWDETVDINLKAGMRLSKLALPYLDASIKAKRLGAIINISSKSGKHYFGSLVPYCASKHGLVGFSLSLFEAVRNAGVRVTVINPGWVDTPMIQELPSYDPEKCLKVEQVAHTVHFVLSFPGTNACPVEITLEPQFE